MQARPGRRWLLGSALCLVLAGLVPPARAQVCALQWPPPPVPALEVAGLRLQRGAQDELQLLDAGTQQVLRRWPLRDRLGRAAEAGAELQLMQAPERRSVLAVIAGLHEIWEISHDPAAEPLFDGLVHDYRMGEGLASPGYLGLRRMPLDQTLGRALLVPGRPWLLAQQGADVVLVHLDVRRLIARVPQAALASLRVGCGRGPDEAPLLLLLSTDSAQGLLALDSRGWRLVAPPPEAQAAMRE